MPTASRPPHHTVLVRASRSRSRSRSRIYVGAHGRHQHLTRLAILQPPAGSSRCRKSPQPLSSVPHSAVHLRWPYPTAHTRSTGTLPMLTSLALTSVSYLACQYLSLQNLLTKRLRNKLCNSRDCCHAIPILCPIQGSSSSSVYRLLNTS